MLLELDEQTACKIGDGVLTLIYKVRELIRAESKKILACEEKTSEVIE